MPKRIRASGGAELVEADMRLKKRKRELQQTPAAAKNSKGRRRPPEPQGVTKPQLPIRGDECKKNNTPVKDVTTLLISKYEHLQGNVGSPREKARNNKDSQAHFSHSETQNRLKILHHAGRPSRKLKTVQRIGPYDQKFPNQRSAKPKVV